MAKKSKEVAKKDTTGLTDQLPDHMKEFAGEGKENIDREDILMPRLKLGQSMSPEVKDKIAEEGDFIHNITKDVLCAAGDTLRIIPIAFSKEYILWYDRKGPKDGMAVRATKVYDNGTARYAWDKPNTEFEDSVGGVVAVKYKTGKFIDEDGLHRWGSQVPGNPDSPPAATAHFNYVVMLPDFDNQLIALSLSRSADKKAREFNTMLNMGPWPSYARIYKMGSFIDQKGDNKFANYQFTGFEKIGLEKDDPFFASLRELHFSLEAKGINVDFSDGDADETKDNSGRF